MSTPPTATTEARIEPEIALNTAIGRTPNVNELLGNAARQPVIGGVIQARFLDAGDLPTASAISLVLMAIITVVVLVYAKFLGTEELV